MIKKLKKYVFGDTTGKCRPISVHEVDKLKHRKFKDVTTSSKDELMYTENGKNVNMGSP